MEKHGGQPLNSGYPEPMDKMRKVAGLWHSRRYVGGYCAKIVFYLCLLCSIMSVRIKPNPLKGWYIMKMLIASDLHGSEHYALILRDLVEKENPDRVLLLGDLLYHGPRNEIPLGYAPKKVIEILNSMKDKILAVRGNCDAEVDQMVLQFPMLANYALLYIDGLPIYVTHGPHEGPHNPPPLFAGEVLLYGHTHVGAEQQQNGYVYLNPGSITLPKDGHHSYMIYENGLFRRFDLDGTLLGQWPGDDGVKTAP